MKNSFKSFYQSSNDELQDIWTDEKTIFIFDTNVLLNLYSYSEHARKEFFQVLEKIQDRLWIPFHVGLEYQRNRLNVIKNEKSVFSGIKNKLENITKTVDDDFSISNLEKRNPQLFEDKENFKEELQGLIDRFSTMVSESDKNQMSVNSVDEIRDRIDILFTDKIGIQPNKEWVQVTSKEGKERFENNIPPAYKDSNKAKKDEPNFNYEGKIYERQYGDLYIWKQIIEHVKNNSDIKNVVFITDDSKEDWWEIIDSRGKKNIDVRFELKAEIYSETEIENFKIYQTNTFLNDSKEYISSDVEDEVIEETKDFLIHKKEQRNHQETMKEFWQMSNPSISVEKITSLNKADKIQKILEYVNNNPSANILASDFAKAYSEIKKAESNDLGVDIHRIKELLNEINPPSYIDKNTINELRKPYQYITEYFNDNPQLYTRSSLSNSVDELNILHDLSKSNNTDFKK